MIIKTKSLRMAFAARLCRLFPPCISGRISAFLYPRELAQRENAGFIARSSLGDITFSFPRADVCAITFATRGFFEWRNVVIANTLCGKGDTIIDIGSNVGTEMLLFAKIVGPTGQVLSFEPLPANYSVLKELVHLNKLKNVELYQAAVSNVGGKLRFLPPEEDFYSGIGRLAENGSQSDDFIEVDTLVLDQMFEAGQLSAPRMIVIDAEGAELFILQGTRRILRQCAPYLILEIQPPLLKHHELSPADLFDFLERHGYKCWVIDIWGLRPVCREECKARNWLCIPNKNNQEGVRTARYVNRQLKLASFLPLIKGINPAVITTSW